jgi:hypothetical protein
MSEKLEVIKTRKGYPALWVGGGATTSKFSARFVMRAGRLARAIFIARYGHRCNAGQALVPLLEGDIVIELSGRRPASPDNPETWYLARQVIGFETDNQEQTVAICKFIDIDLDSIPPSVWEGAEIYHNREGRYFISE